MTELSKTPETGNKRLQMCGSVCSASSCLFGGLVYLGVRLEQKSCCESEASGGDSLKLYNFHIKILII